ncbi:hypothetical protein [Marinobacter mobilis]|uniref:Rho-binding antiterminator n=1 Tax=Marinobacter mobilis TaxID=488533 RepID=A0A1H2SZX7_9GAMM|nr:hypothetical protein [Marinobacter mobilis]SDW37138.1 Rho-binding antiterminator [Marinobacter mobilis]
MTNHYQPVGCAVQRTLRNYQQSGQLVELVYRDEAGQVQTIHEVVRDLFSRAGEDFMLTGRGKLVRLDHLILVNGETLAGT